MKKTLWLAALMLFAAGFAAPARAQCPYTTVTATITDPNGLPYSYGVVTYSLTGTTSQPLCATIPFDGNPHQVGLDITGTFSVSLPQNASIVPAATKWAFSVTANAGVPAPIGKGSVSFSIANQTISGSSQSLTTVFNASAPALTNFSGGGGSGIPCTTIANSVQINFGGAFGCTDITFASSTLTASSSDTIDFSAAVALKVPASSGYAPNGTEVFGYNTTTNNFVGGEGFGSYIFGVVSSGATITNGHLVGWSGSLPGNILLNDGGVLPAFQTNGTPNGTQTLLNLITSTANTCGLTNTATLGSGDQVRFEITGPVNPGCGGTGIAGPTADSLLITQGSSTMTLLTSPAVNGQYVVVFNVTGGAAVAPTAILQGIPVNAQSGNYPLVYSDRFTFIRESGTTTASLTIPALGSGSFANNFGFVTANFNTGIMSITPTTPNNIDGGSGQAASTVYPNFAAFVYSDGSNNEWTLKVPMQAAFPSCSGSTNALTFNTTTGVFGCNTISGGGISGLTTGFIPKAASATSLTNSLCDEGITTANVLTCTDSAGITMGPTSSSAAYLRGAAGAVGGGGADGSFNIQPNTTLGVVGFYTHNSAGMFTCTDLGGGTGVCDADVPLLLDNGLLTTAQTLTSAYANISGVSVAVNASTYYFIDCTVLYSGDGTNGANFKVTGPASPTSLTVYASGPGGGTGTYTTAASSAFGTAITAFSANVSNTTYMLDIRISLQNLNAGTVQLQAESATGAGTPSALAGTVCVPL